MKQLSGPTLDPAAGNAAKSLVIFLHGYGADGNDLIDIGRMWSTELPDTAFAAPHAPDPCAMAPVGRQWFPLQRLEPDEFRIGVYQAAPLLAAYIDAERARHTLPMSAVALVGFSQGTMMALHAGLRLPEPVAGIVGYSGALAAPESLQAEMTSKPPITLYHGDQDEVVPVSATHDATKFLNAANVEVSAQICPGLGHGIDQIGLVGGLAFLKDKLPTV